MLVGISTSGNSPNVIRALEKGNELEIEKVVLNSGKERTKIGDVSKLYVAAAFSDRIASGRLMPPVG